MCIDGRKSQRRKTCSTHTHIHMHTQTNHIDTHTHNPSIHSINNLKNMNDTVNNNVVLSGQ